jgi:hypothetical protein
MTKLYSLLFAAVFAVACAKKEGEPRKIVFDRDVCARCGMQLSDPRFVAQAVSKADGSNSVFEEMGCGVVWMEQNGWDRYDFYVADLKTGKWIKFEEAFFTVEYLTPMSYGIAALADKNRLEEGKSLISRDDALARIRAIYSERQKGKIGD